MYKILTKRTSFIERSIVYEVDGEVKTIHAPSACSTFDDLIAILEKQYGEKKEETENVENTKASTKTRRKSTS